jgi:hypothetical protein
MISDIYLDGDPHIYIFGPDTSRNWDPHGKSIQRLTMHTNIQSCMKRAGRTWSPGWWYLPVSVSNVRSAWYIRDLPLRFNKVLCR